MSNILHNTEDGMLVKVEGLWKTFSNSKKSNYVIQDVTLSVRKGEVFALLGPNGAGKTTIIKTILNFIFPSKGNVFMMGLPVSNRLARRSIGYAPEDVTLPEFRNANLFLKFLGELSAIPADELKTRIIDLLNKAELSESKQRIGKFSKGMKRRLILAQALLHRPELLILDEPTDGLDPIEQKRVVQLLDDYRKKGGTILLCSHNLTEVEKLCDRYAILNHGKIIHESTKTDFSDDGYIIYLSEKIPDLLIPRLPENCTIDHNIDGEHIVVGAKKHLASVITLIEEYNINVKDIKSNKTDLNSLFVRYVENQK